MRVTSLVFVVFVLFHTGCASVSFPIYPTISGVIVDSGRPVENLKVKLLIDSWESDSENCEGESSTTKTNESGEFKFKQKNKRFFISPFNFETAGDELMEDNDLILCVWYEKSYSPILEMDDHDVRMSMIHGVRISCDLSKSEDICAADFGDLSGW